MPVDDDERVGQSKLRKLAGAVWTVIRLVETLPVEQRRGGAVALARHQGARQDELERASPTAPEEAPRAPATQVRSWSFEVDVAQLRGDGIARVAQWRSSPRRAKGAKPVP